VDFAEAWSKIGDGTKSARRVSATATVNTLDTLASVCAPVAARWDAEAERRRQLRTPENLKRLMDAQRAHNSARSTAAAAKSQRRTARSATRNPLAATRRAARTADRAASRHADTAKNDVKTARKSYPQTLAALVAKIHAAHATAAGLASWVLTSAHDTLTLWPAEVSAGAVAVQVGALYLGRRTVSTAVPDDLSAEERRLASRLDPSYWVQNADDRGLSGTVPTPAETTPAGLVSHVRLDGRWTPRTFAAKADEIRALLGARTDLRMEIRPGSHGDRATITLRTRNAAEGADLSGWTPGCPWGIDTVSGEPVMVPLGRRMLIAGTSGSGKSWSTRALLAEASHRGDHRLVVIDPKRVEAINWEHRARVAITRDDVLDVTDELVAEMHERLNLVPRGRDTIEISADRPRITVFVDEGAEVISMSRDKEYRRVMENLSTLARMARATEIILIWATQKPTMDAKGGIDPQVSAQITYRAALALSTSGESRTVFGDDATEKGWHAHELPMPGVALLRSGPKAKPHPIRTRAFSPADVIALPDRPVWRRDAAVPAADARPALRLVKSGDYELAPPVGQQAPATPAVDAGTNRDRVLAAVRGGARTAKDVAAATGLNKGTVSREVKALVTAGALVRAEDGTLTAAAGEVSA
jgi:S-DNA-T family DNA segregation ATPase FtsK/SpoIIIE